MKIIFDAENAIVGRMGSVAAKELLKGNEVVIINSEKAMVSGRKEDIMKTMIEWKTKGGSSQKGPLVSRMPDRFLKRMLRGMLPWNITKGREAYKRLRCYEGTRGLQGKKFSHNIPRRYLTIKQITDLIQ